MEIQKLKSLLQKASQQNSLLAQANSAMQSDLNLGKDKLKALQHELGCVVAVLKVKNLEVEELKSKRRACEGITHEVQEGDWMDADTARDTSFADKEKNICHKGRKRPPKKTQSWGFPTETSHVNEKGERRSSTRRRSTLSSREGRIPMVELLEIVDSPASLSITELNGKENHALMGSSDPSDSHPSSVSIKKHKDECESYHKDSNQRPERASLSRPVRRAAEKVISYKEIPLNMKMRRED